MKRFARPAGYVVVAAALWFLARQFAEDWPTIAAWRPGPAVVGAFITLGVVYGAVLFLLAESWHRIVGLFGAEGRQRTYRSYTATQIARYIPGNVMHIVGRALWLRGGRLTDGAIARATGLELLVTPVGAVVALALMLPFARLEGLPLLDGARPLIAVGSVALIGGLLLMSRIGPVAKRFAALTAPVLLATGFMLLLGLIFAMIVNLVGSAPVLLAAAVALTGWIVGYATPGAPGGLGSREAVVVALLGAIGAGESAVLIAILFRLVTTLGELTCFATGALVWRRLRPAAPALAG
ncbi:hypothetical protein [Pelagovum pacificum]|uniref:Flippase-like domain-containing protein n=1 Tax=Pelagovum pacificum TaxID=2588711 RepID=A0A5C5GAQ9_9RHOB|nr:hypothetical protein [Pelagovum pacificum]QQA42037.1 hypothetical protein I8N54_14730 [Pelagovum pacificum]TNY31127.1 hypothetical protein FHY64_13915 [Pelagovum pacificum]